MKNPIAQAKKWFALRGTKRSKDWPEARREHLRREPWCRGCGAATGLEVHHIEPFHAAPWRELDPKNLLTLCENIGRQCHLRKGHLGNWKNINPNILKTKLAPRPLSFS